MSLVPSIQLQAPLVTIAIPTFNRAALLERSIDSAIRQTYGNLEILVSDNASPDIRVQRLLAEISSLHPNVRTFVQERNQGPVNNFLFLLKEARGQYFMWLADDDEISENYVSSLVQDLKKNPDAVTAMGQWILVQADGRHIEMEMGDSIFSDKSTRNRLLSYCWRSKDAFYYGLHRTDALRRARFGRHWWPNQDVVLNRAYVYLFDMVAQGRIILATDRSALWLNHHYSEKLYAPEHRGSLSFLTYAMRRLNIYWCYFAKALRWRKFSSAAAMIVVAPLAWIRDVRGPFAALLAAIPRKISRIG